MTTIIILMLVFLFIAIYGWGFGDSWSFFNEICAIGGSCGFVWMSIVSFVPLDHTNSLYFDATSTKIGNEIIVQSPGLPTQIVSDIKFIDKPLVIRKDILVNCWGVGETNEFKVELKK